MGTVAPEDVETEQLVSEKPGEPGGAAQTLLARLGRGSSLLFVALATVFAFACFLIVAERVPVTSCPAPPPVCVPSRLYDASRRTLLVSLDGFRHAYLTQLLSTPTPALPAFRWLAAQGAQQLWGPCWLFLLARCAP